MNPGGNRHHPQRRKRRSTERLEPAAPEAAPVRKDGSDARADAAPDTPARGAAAPAAPAAKAPAAKPARPERAERPASPAQALERLRAGVLDAVRELERLRAENEILTQRVLDLEHEGGRTPDVVLPFADTPEAMREKMDEFIGALDAFLALDAAPEPPPSTS